MTSWRPRPVGANELAGNCVDKDGAIEAESIGSAEQWIQMHVAGSGQIKDCNFCEGKAMIKNGEDP